MENEILEYARELWDHGQDILHERNKDRLPSRNSGACMLYGSPCQFLGVCSGYDTIGSSKWQRKPVLHPELGTEGDLLTNSRIRCFQTCRRKHHYQFEMGVERADQEERESLFFGTLFHVGLESLFISMKGSSDAVEYEATA